MERNYPYQYGAAAEKMNDDIEVPYFVTPEYQRAKRLSEMYRQQLENPERTVRSNRYEQIERERHKNIGKRVNQAAVQHNHKNTRANRAKSKSNLQAFAIRMTTIFLLSTAIAIGFNTNTNEAPKENLTKVKYDVVDTSMANPKFYSEALPEISVDFSELSSEETEENIHHYESEALNRENLSADQFCENLDEFLASGQELTGHNLEEKTWNLLHNQIGCSSKQSAAILGNMLVEDPSLNPFQHQVYDDIAKSSNEDIVKNQLGIGPFQFSGDRKKAFLKFVQDHTEYNDLYDKFTSPKKYGATNVAELFDTNLSHYNLTEEDCDRGLKCIFAYISYEMQYPDDAHYNRNQWNKTIIGEDDNTEEKSVADLAIQFAQFFERTDSGYEQRASSASDIYYKYSVKPI